MYQDIVFQFLDCVSCWQGKYSPNDDLTQVELISIYKVVLDGF